MDTMLRSGLDNDLGELQEQLEKMGNGVKKALDKLFFSADEKDEKKLTKLLKSERKFSDMEREIESACLYLITKRHPMARDLREVTACLRVVHDLKRCGDSVTEMAELLLRLKNADIRKISVYMSPLIEAAKKMFADSIYAYVETNTSVAQGVIVADDEVDELFNQVKKDVISNLQHEILDADECVDVLMLAKYLEKLGDHAVNIGEWTIFKKVGEIQPR